MCIPPNKQAKNEKKVNNKNTHQPTTNNRSNNDNNAYMCKRYCNARFPHVPFTYSWNSFNFNRFIIVTHTLVLPHHLWTDKIRRQDDDFLPRRFLCAKSRAHTHSYAQQIQIMPIFHGICSRNFLFFLLVVIWRERRKMNFRLIWMYTHIVDRAMKYIWSKNYVGCALWSQPVLWSKSKSGVPFNFKINFILTAEYLKFQVICKIWLELSICSA